MSFPAWVKPGARCVCIDGDWKNTYNIPSCGPYPQANERFTIAGSGTFLDVAYVIVAEQGVAQEWYGVDGFRPLTMQEMDEEMFQRLLKGASEEKLRELELML